MHAVILLLLLKELLGRLGGESAQGKEARTCLLPPKLACVDSTRLNLPFASVQYALIWDNKLETNYAVGACACLTPNETCVFDRITTIHFDRSPMRNGMCCYCIPATCCGPPVIYSKEQKICGVLSTAPCCGVGIYASPCRSDTAFRLCVALPFFAKTVPFLVAVAAGT